MRSASMRAWALAVASGLLQALAFPSPSLDWLVWAAVAPLMVAVLGGEGRRPGLGRGFLLGYACGVTWYAATCYWVYHVMHTWGGLAPPVALGLLALFCLYLGLYHGLFGLLLALVARRGQEGVRRALLLAPFFWVAVELARARLTGFPWNLLGTAQVSNLPLSQVATVTGVYGLSFEILLVNAALAAAFVVPLRRRRWVLAAALGAAVVLQGGRVVTAPPLAGEHRAVLVQADIPILNSEEWTAEYLDRTLAEMGQVSASATRAAAEGSPGLVVWPESPAPFYTADPRFRHAVSRLASETNSYFMVGGLGVPMGGERPAGAPGESPRIYNSAALITPAGEWAGRYDKIHLVPFGEYVPFKRLLWFADKLTREVGDFGRGSERRPLELGGLRVGAFICYESVFPDEVRQFAAQGAQVFVNISNDGWFGRTGAPGQHLNMARMRAIENRRWLLRATNTGITAAIDPYGRVVARAAPEERAVLVAPYAVVQETTFYTRHGDWFALACAIISLAGLALALHGRVPGKRP